VKISYIDFHLAVMMIMDLVFVLDKLASLLGIAGNIGDRYWQFNLQVEFNGC